MYLRSGQHSSLRDTIQSDICSVLLLGVAESTLAQWPTASKHFVDWDSCTSSIPAASQSSTHGTKSYACI